MKVKENRWRKGFGWILLIIFLCLFAECDGTSKHYIKSPFAIPEEAAFTPHRRHGSLSQREYEAAKNAWAYFKRVTVKNTGLPEGAVGSTVISMWDVAGYLAALVCAKRLKIISTVEFNQRMTRLVYWLNTMELNGVGLPNKFYSAKTGKMLNVMGQPGVAGHSAIDLGRLLIWLRIVRNEFIAHAEAVDRAVLRWNFRHVLDNKGALYGSYVKKNGLYQYYREGRMGLRQYSAKGFSLWGFRTDAARRYDHVSQVTILNYLLPFDNRPPGLPPQYGATTTRIISLDGFEFLWKEVKHEVSFTKWDKDPYAYELAKKIYLIQRARFQTMGLLTARDPHNLDRPPYYVIDAIYVDGKPFHTMTANGRARPEDACISVSAAFSLWALFKSPFTDRIMEAVRELRDKNGGWYAGIYEKDGAINRAISLADNASILESLAFKAQGPLYHQSERPGYWEKILTHEKIAERGLPPKVFQDSYEPLMPNLKGTPKVR